MNSRQLLAEVLKGAEILHNGTPVAYAPRRPGDMSPWVYREGLHWYRYTAAQCVAYYPPEKEGS